MPDPMTIITHNALRDEATLLAQLLQDAQLDPQARAQITAAGAALVSRIRASVKPGLMEVFLAEYGLSTDEGIALMCLAEALLRVPDAPTMDALIEDKIAPADWGKHLGQSASSLVNASTWALMLSGKVLEEAEPGVVGHLRAMVKRLGEPVIRRAVMQAMKEMGRQFVLGETIEGAMKRARTLEAKGFTYSYDMLGEAARTEADARRYHLSYSKAITAIAAACTTGDIRTNPGISIKLSALHPRYEVAKRERVMAELVPRVRALCGLAKAAGMGLNIDAEEADRLALSLEVIEEVLADPTLAGWDGFGVVVQAYGRRCGAVIDWLHDLAVRLDRRIMLRLVKGAYWDGEIKRAQVLGLKDFPVFTRKQATDVSYIANARKLMGMTDRIYPQFAGHNAHTVAAILHIAREKGVDNRAFEFQRLHGMGERLHDIVHEDHKTGCRIYAPVGAHRDLLAYLVRRLLENGANSSFVNQIVDESVSPQQVAACPLTALENLPSLTNPNVAKPANLFGKRLNSLGFDLTDAADLARIEAARAPWANIALPAPKWASVTEVAQAFDAATLWSAPAPERAAVLRRAADLMEADFGRIFAILSREAGKVLGDAVAELREAVDFLRYYADQAEGLTQKARGTFVCISPWNFPLAIFTGQVAAALAAGNAILAKPAEQTPLIADLAVSLLHQAGVPKACLQLLQGDGQIGQALTADARVAGVAFTGSTETAQSIRRALATAAPQAVLIAETGGLNAMLVDSTALPEQAVRDIVVAAFQSAGQRCSALRCLYVQEDIAPAIEEMLIGAMQELTLGNPWHLTTDIGPVIDAEAQGQIAAYIQNAKAQGRLIHQMPAPTAGHFIGPAILRVQGIRDLEREIFGPVLHIATFKAGQIDEVITAINQTGYGLTFGLHSRIDDRVQRISETIHAGNVYINRNQIGAVVGSQPFGGEGLSGTGPKAGGPMYLTRFTKGASGQAGQFDSLAQIAKVQADLTALGGPQKPLNTQTMPGPTGESNRLSTYPRAPFLCMGPGPEAVKAQAEALRHCGGLAVEVNGQLPLAALTQLQGFGGVIWWGEPADLQKALAARSGPILPLVQEIPDASWALAERHICIDTTASGGNAELLVSASA